MVGATVYPALVVLTSTMQNREMWHNNINIVGMVI